MGIFKCPCLEVMQALSEDAASCSWGPSSLWPVGRAVERESWAGLTASWMEGHWPGALTSFFQSVSWLACHRARSSWTGQLVLESYRSVSDRLTLQISLAPVGLMSGMRPAVPTGPLSTHLTSSAVAWAPGCAGSIGSADSVFAFGCCVCSPIYFCCSQKPSGRAKMELTPSWGHLESGKEKLLP